MSHALDTTGRKFNKNGILTEWWQQRDVVEYERRSECFVQQYDHYGIDGSLTLGENIADNVGLKISYEAFKNTKDALLPAILPSLGVYTNEQLFFISFAQLWCEISTASPFLNEGEHSPVKQRVLGTLSNSAEFHTAFNCNQVKNSNKCTLW